MCSGVQDQCAPWACLRWRQLPLTTSVGPGSRPSSMERAGVAGTGYCTKGPSRGMVLPTSTPASATCNHAFSNSLASSLSSHTDLTSSGCLFCRVRNTIGIPHLLYLQPCLPSSLSRHTCAPLHTAVPSRLWHTLPLPVWLSWSHVVFTKLFIPRLLNAKVPTKPLGKPPLQISHCRLTPQPDSLPRLPE